jgi:hypothetical protein
VRDIAKPDLMRQCLLSNVRRSPVEANEVLSLFVAAWRI